MNKPKAVQRVAFILGLTLLITACGQEPSAGSSTPSPTARPSEPATPFASPTSPATRLVDAQISAPSLTDNLLGDLDKRWLTIYLPPSYYLTDLRFPVLYYLPGFGSGNMARVDLPQDLDNLVERGAIGEMLIVIVSGANALGGSFYVNSPVTGNWEDFLVADVVAFIDANYRTLARAEARGISGHSMGGFGALNIAMLHPDVFGTVYSLSPGLFDEQGLGESQMFYPSSAVDSYLAFERELGGMSLQGALAAMKARQDFTVAYGSAFAPNPDKHPPYLDYPYQLADGEPVLDPAIWEQWSQGFGGVREEVLQYRDNLLSLQGLVVDYGLNDGYAWIPKGCEYFSAQLTAAGIPHQLLTYEGAHDNLLGERIREHMLPFFSALLTSQ